MSYSIKIAGRAICGAIAAAALCLSAIGASAADNTAQGTYQQGYISNGTKPGKTKTVIAERYNPTIWVDPDGCEHWVFDDGFEGYMTPNVRRDGTPVCRRGDVCGVMNTDQLFATDKYSISAANQRRIADFFRSSDATAFIVNGHTDSRASDAYNLRLSLNRATSVAKVALANGAKVVDIRGYGERQPRATNSTAAGMQLNRRVEIICLR